MNDNVSDNNPALSGVLNSLFLIDFINLFRLSSLYYILIGALVLELSFMLSSLLFNGIVIFVFLSLISNNNSFDLPLPTTKIHKGINHLFSEKSFSPLSN